MIIALLLATIILLLVLLRSYVEECSILEQIVKGQGNQIAFLKETQLPPMYVVLDSEPSNDNRVVH